MILFYEADKNKCTLCRNNTKSNRNRLVLLLSANQ